MAEATMTVKEAAQLLGIDERSVREKLVSGELAGERKMVGLKPKWFVCPEAVDVARQRQGLMRRFKRTVEPGGEGGNPHQPGDGAAHEPAQPTSFFETYQSPAPGSSPLANPPTIYQAQPTLRTQSSGSEMSDMVNHATDCATQKVSERVLSELPLRLREAQRELVREITEHIVKNLSSEIERMLDQRFRKWAASLKTGQPVDHKEQSGAVPPQPSFSFSSDEAKGEPDRAAAQYRELEAKVLYQRLVRLQEEARQHQAEKDELKKELEKLRTVRL